MIGRTAWSRLLRRSATLLALSATTAASAQTVLKIDAAASGPHIERDIFGQFAEHLGSGIYGGIWVGRDSKIPNVRGIRSDVVAALRAIRVPNVRWPGGCFADEYHWRNGIGPSARRAVTVNSNWGGVPEPNSFGTEEYMDFIHQIGSEAFVSVNVGSGTPEEASNWLEYLTTSQPTSLQKERAANGHPAPYTVKFLGLGNENWGCGGAMSPDHYVEEMKRFGHFVRNTNPAQKSDNQMKRIAVGWDSDAKDYTEAVMKAWAAKTGDWDIEAVSLHNYVLDGWPPHLPATGFGEEDYAKAIREAFRMDDKIVHETAIMDRYDPKKKVALSVDEWGIWLAPTPGSNPGFLQQQNSLRDAVLASVTLNIFMRHADRVRMANIAQMINVLQAMVLTDGPKMVLTPTYYVYKMYLPFQDATFVPISYDAGTYHQGDKSMPRLDAVAARDSSGQLWLALTNVDPNKPAELVLNVEGKGIGSAQGQLLTADRVDAVNSFTAPDVVAPRPISAVRQDNLLRLTLPPKSVAVLGLRP